MTLAPFAEDDGSIPLAGDPLVASIRAQRAHQQPDRQRAARQHRHRQRRLRLPEAHGDRRTAAHIDTDTPTGPLDTVVALYDAAGTIGCASNDDSGGTLDSFLQFNFTVTGTYFVMISGFGVGTVFPADPFDSGSGLGAGSEGPYDVTVTVAFSDRDFYAIDLAAGDVRRRVGHRRGAPGSSSATSDGAEVDRLRPGRDLHLRAQRTAARWRQRGHRPRRGRRGPLQPRGRWAAPARTTSRSRSTGPAPRRRPRAPCRRCSSTSTVPGSTPRSGAGPGVRDLSPLAGFLGRWGLTAAQENAVINQTVAAVRENIVADLRGARHQPTVQPEDPQQP